MPYPPVPERASAPRSQRNAGRLALGGLLLLACVRCTFPEYDIRDSTGGMASGARAGAGAETSGAEPGGTGAQVNGGSSVVPAGGSDAGSGALAGMGGVAECEGEQWPVDHCVAGCLLRYPDHCYDSKLSGDEVDVNCGGSCQRCTNEVCSSDADCLSGQCVAGNDGAARCYAPLGINYTAHELNSSVSSVAWSMRLTNNEPSTGETFAFRDLKLRYYFERSALIEPLIVRATQSNLRLANGQTRELKMTSWAIERTEAQAGVVYDAYVEIGFSEAGQFFPGDSIELYQQMLTGDTSHSNFDQRANYSFTDQLDSPFLRVTVHNAGKLVWGLEPRPANPRRCFARGVNLNGPALSVEGNAWESSMQDGVVASGAEEITQASAAFPPVSGGLATLLQSAFRLDAGEELSWPVENGTYLLFAYAVSPGNDGSASDFTVQGEPPLGAGKFRSQAADGGQAWARLGPFRVDVTDGAVRMGVTSGAVSLAGLELWYPE